MAVSAAPAPGAGRFRMHLLGGAALVALTGPGLAQEADDDGLVLSTIAVEAAAQSGSSPLNGFAPEVSATATKTDTPILETPQSVAVVGQEQMQVTGAQSLTQAFNYSPGIAGFGGEDGTGDSLITRGFRLDPFTGNILRDGLRWAVNVFDGGQEPFGLERAEVLKGPSSVMYGQGGPAGVLNTVSKRPSAERLREVNATYGTDDWKALSTDLGGAIDDDGVWTWRLTALTRDAESFVDHVPLDRDYVAPALTWSPDARTSLTLLGMYQHDVSAYVYGLPLEGTILPNPNGQIPRNRFVGEPGYDNYDSTVWAGTFLFEHSFTPSLIFRTSGRYYRADVDMPAIWTGSFEPDMATITRAAQDRTDWSEGAMADTSVEIGWNLGATSHTTLVGFDMSYGEHSTDRANRPADPLDLFDPVYGGAIGDPYSFWHGVDRTDRLGLYAQDQITFGRWVATVGGRQDWVRYTDHDLLTGQYNARDEKSDAFTGRLGLVWLGPNGIAPYLSYSQSFEPTGGLDRQGERLKPTTGDQYEAGVRWQPRGDILLSAAVYQITQENVTTVDPIDPTFSAQDGKVRSRGVELSAQGQVTENLSLIAAYAYTDAHTIESSPATPELDGERTGNVPYNQASLWADYRFNRFGLPGLRAGAGIRYIGDSVASWSGGDVPSYTLVDMSASYDWQRWSVALNGTNLGDESYVNCTYSCFYGEPRSVMLTASYRW